MWHSSLEVSLFFFCVSHSTCYCSIHHAAPTFSTTTRSPSFASFPSCAAYNDQAHAQPQEPAHGTQRAVHRGGSGGNTNTSGGPPSYSYGNAGKYE